MDWPYINHTNVISYPRVSICCVDWESSKRFFPNRFVISCVCYSDFSRLPLGLSSASARVRFPHCRMVSIISQLFLSFHLPLSILFWKWWPFWWRVRMFWRWAVFAIRCYVLRLLFIYHSCLSDSLQYPSHNFSLIEFFVVLYINDNIVLVCLIYRCFYHWPDEDLSTQDGRVAKDLFIR